MKFSIKKFKKNLIVSWGFSYILVISIMLVAIMFISLIYNSTSKNILVNFNEYIFNNVSNDVDDTLGSMNRMCISIRSNKNLATLLSKSGNVNTKESTYLFIEDLKSYSQFSENVDSYYVYIPSSDMIISPFGAYTSSLYYIINYNPEKISYEDWKLMLTDTDKQVEYADLPSKDVNGNDINSIAQIFSVPSYTDECVGVVLSNKNNFIKGLENINWESLCDIYIYNSEGNLISYSKNLTDENVLGDLKDFSKIQKSKHNVYSSSIAINGQAWQVVTVSSGSDANRPLFIAQIVIIGLVLILLLILFYVVKNILSKNYKPIKNMLSTFKITETENEYESLTTLINDALSENQSLLKELDNNTKKIKQLNLAKLLRGEITLSNSEDFGFNFHKGYFCVLTFYLKKIQDLFSDDADLSDLNRFSYLSFIVDNIISELMSQKSAKVFTTEVDGNIVCLINTDEPIEDEDVCLLAHFGLDFINKHFDINLTFALSEVIEGSLNIPLAYNQTVEILDHKRFLEIEEPMQYVRNIISNEEKYIFDFGKEQILVNSIKTGNHEDALELLKQIFDELDTQNNLTFDHITYIVFDIVCTITKAASSVLSSFGLNDSLAFYKKIKDGENISSLYQQITEYVLSVCEAIRTDIAEGKNRTHFLVSHIEKYIRDNYADPNMTVYSIGQHFNVKPDYISKIFKKEVGKPLLTYITHFRVEKGIELMKQGKFSKKEISNMVGFNYARNFYRALKKYEEENLDALEN